MRVRAILSLPRDGRFVGPIRAAVASLLAELDAPAATTADVQLALTEACGNVIRHAGTTHQYEVSIEAADGRCELQIRDHGPGFSQGPVAPPDDDFDLDVGGRGLTIMEAVADEFRITDHGGGTCVLLVKTWES